MVPRLLSVLLILLPLVLSVEKCRKDVIPGASIIFYEHCPGILQLKDPDIYFGCIVDKGFHFYGTRDDCIDEFHDGHHVLKESTKTFLQHACAVADGKTEKDSIELICCVVFKELLINNRTADAKVEASRVCLEEQKTNGNWVQ